MFFKRQRRINPVLEQTQETEEQYSFSHMVLVPKLKTLHKEKSTHHSSCTYKKALSEVLVRKIQPCRVSHTP